MMGTLGACPIEIMPLESFVFGTEYIWGGGGGGGEGEKYPGLPHPPV